MCNPYLQVVLSNKFALFWTVENTYTCILSNLIMPLFEAPTFLKALSPTSVYHFPVYGVIVHNHTCTCIYVGYTCTFTLTSPGKSNQKEAFGMAFLPLFFRTKIWNITPPTRYTNRRLKNLTNERKKPVFNHINEYLTHCQKKSFVHMYLYSS